MAYFFIPHKKANKNSYFCTPLNRNTMSKDSIINNLFRVASNMFTQFNTEEPLISEETKVILNSTEGRKEIYTKIISNPKKGDVTVTVNGQKTKFFVEA